MARAHTNAYFSAELTKGKTFCQVKYRGLESSIKFEFECIKGGTDSIDVGNGHYKREGEIQFMKIQNTVV